MRKPLIIILCGIFILNILTLGGFSLAKGQPDLLLKLNNDNIVLTASLDSGHYVFGNFKLKIGNKEKNFNWKSIGNLSFPPYMKLIDLGNDKNAGVIIFLIENKGMGIFLQKVHVFRIDSFKEIPVEDPLIVVEKHVKLQSANDSIIVEIDGNKTVLDKNYLDKHGSINPSEKLSFNDHIAYDVKNNNLSAEVGICDENFFYIGAIHMDYTYESEMFASNKNSFKKF